MGKNIPEFSTLFSFSTIKSLTMIVKDENFHQCAQILQKTLTIKNCRFLA